MKDRGRHALHAAEHVRWWTCAVSMACLLFLGGANGCWTAAQLDAASTGRLTVYDSGTPSFDLETISTIREGRTGVDVFLFIPHNALTYERRLDGYVSVFEVLIRFYDPRGRVLLEEHADQGTREVYDEATTRSSSFFLFEKRLDVRVGTYIVEVILKDAATELRTRRRHRLQIADPGLAKVQLSGIRLEEKWGSLPFRPVHRLYVSSAVDSVRAVVEAYSRGGSEAVRVAAHLIRFPSDTTVAEVPYWQVSPGALSQRGVRFDRGDTLQTKRLELPALVDTQTLRFGLPVLTEGIYRITATVYLADAAGDVLIGRQVRDFAVRAPSFPRISTLDEMAEALVYLARQGEYKEILEGATPEEKRVRFDAFWGSLLPDRDRATRLLQLYYDRVEEANRLFSNYKEGWKTDQGMIYILLGPPLFVENRIDAEVWYYSYNESDPFNAFIFEHANLSGSDGAFETFLLLRQPYYDRAWQRALDRWRRGRVLEG